jgi:alanine racemase
MNSSRLRNTYAEIHLGRIRSNLRRLKDLAQTSSPNSQIWICPMVKADAYGHGDVEIALACEKEGVDQVGVVLVEEGIRIRAGGVHLPILVFGLFDVAGAEEVVRYNLTPVLSSFEQIERLSKVLEGPSRYPVHVKFNTGMTRLGFDAESANAVLEYFKRQSVLELKGICTHLASPDDAAVANSVSARQMKIWNHIQEVFEPLDLIHHTYSSGAVLRGIKHFSKSAKVGLRPGISIYGGSPFDHNDSDYLKSGLEPAMSLKTELVMVRHVPAGTAVSYGSTWTAKRKSWIGVVGIGYGDGLPRRLSNIGSMLYRGDKVPIVGRVCMDHTMLDLTDRVGGADPEEGEEIVVFGRQGITSYSVEEVARLCETISYEILSCLTARVPRVYLGSQ